MSTPNLMVVMERIDGAHPKHADYPLLPGDALTRNPDGTWTKHTGLCLWGFVLTPEQEASLKPTDGHIVLDGSL